MQEQSFGALGPDKNSQNKIRLCFIGIHCSKNLNILFTPDVFAEYNQQDTTFTISLFP